MDLLANRKQEGVWCGEILVNQCARTAFFHRDSAYVLQDDLHLPTLTVRETLTYAAWVKLPEGTSVVSREERVEFLLRMMGLEHVQESPVGDAMQKVGNFDSMTMIRAVSVDWQLPQFTICHAM